MLNQQDENFMENALIALTWIETTQNPDRETAAADQQLMLKTYGMEKIYSGAMLCLAVILALNAFVSSQKLVDRIQTERENIRENLPKKFDHEKIFIALTYIELDQNPDLDKAKADKQLVIDTYTQDYIYEGALLALTVMMLAQASNLNLSLVENTARVRRLMRDRLHFASEG